MSSNFFQEEFAKQMYALAQQVLRDMNSNFPMFGIDQQTSVPPSYGSNQFLAPIQFKLQQDASTQTDGPNGVGSGVYQENGKTL